MDVIITPTTLKGAITPPPSKSQGHRLLIAAYLAGCPHLVTGATNSQDIAATRRCMELLTGTAPTEQEDPVLNCGESGSTLRFLIPLALALQGGGSFTGQGRLMERPLEPYFNIFDEKGISYEQNGSVLSVLGELPAGVYALPGNVSSQFVTGLMFALPLTGGDSDIMLTTPLESRSYVDMTIDALAKFSVEVTQVSPSHYHVPGGQRYIPTPAAVEADWSQAGFWYAAKGIGNAVEVTGMDHTSRQGDRVIAQHYVNLCQEGEVVIDVSDCPDLVPPLAAHAALRAGQVTRMVNAARLRVKESDRLAAVTEELNKLGAKVEAGPDSLTIHGVSALTGGVVASRNDHRIAMMLAIAATRATGPVTIRDAGAVAKSYPNFWQDYVNLGGQIKEVLP